MGRSEGRKPSFQRSSSARNLHAAEKQGFQKKSLPLWIWVVTKLHWRGNILDSVRFEVGSFLREYSWVEENYIFVWALEKLLWKNWISKLPFEIQKVLLLGIINARWKYCLTCLDTYIFYWKLKLDVKLFCCACIQEMSSEPSCT